MNSFTQAVDSSLWSSRAFDDAEYDAATAEPFVTPAISLPSPPAAPTLILLVGPAPAALARSHFGAPLPPAGSIGALPLVWGSTAADAAAAAPLLLAVPHGGAVSDAHAAAWARCVLDALRPARVVVLAALPAFRVGGGGRRGAVDGGEYYGAEGLDKYDDNDDGDDDASALRVLGAPADSLACRVLDPPAMLEGVAAAALCEADFRPGVTACAYVAGVGTVGMDGPCLASLSAALDAELGTSPAHGERRERTKRHAAQIRQASINSNCNTLYT